MKLKVLIVFALIAGLCFLGCEGPVGAKGADGQSGANGQPGVQGDKGDKGDKGIKGEDGDPGDDGHDGERGEQGEQGDRGDSVRLLGQLPDMDALNAKTGSDEAGLKDAWMVGGILYIWNGSLNDGAGDWESKGPIEGPAGPQGEKGLDGEPGKDADNVAVVTVNYVTDSNDVTVDEQILLWKGKLQEPVTPLKTLKNNQISQTGLFRDYENLLYEFTGWYDGTGAEAKKWDFDDPVHENMTLHARYTAPEPISSKNDATAVWAENVTPNITQAVAYITGKATTDVFVLYMGHDVALSHAPVNVSGNCKLIIAGLHGQRHINLNANGSLLALNGANVDITIRDIQFTGLATNTAPLVNVEGGAKFTMENATLTGNTISNTLSADNTKNYRSAGVRVVSSTFTMKGNSVITGNELAHASWSTPLTLLTLCGASGVCISGGTFAMSDSSIISNNSISYSTMNALSNRAGGVYMASGTFTMSDNSLITKNKGGVPYNIHTGGAGGVIMGVGGVGIGGGTFTMNGNSAITENNYLSRDEGQAFTFYNSGSGYNVPEYKLVSGGVAINGGTFTMNGGKINDNVVGRGQDTSIGISSPLHYVNNGTDYYVGTYKYIRGAGGVAVNNGTFTMNNGEIKGNNSWLYVSTNHSMPHLSSAGGVLASKENGSFIMNGGSITENNACGSFDANGGFSSMSEVSGGVFNPTTINGGAITGNIEYRNASNTNTTMAYSGNASLLSTTAFSQSTRNNDVCAIATFDLGGNAAISEIYIVPDGGNAGQYYSNPSNIVYTSFFQGINVNSNWTGDGVVTLNLYEPINRWYGSNTSGRIVLKGDVAGKLSRFRLAGWANDGGYTIARLGTYIGQLQK